MKGYPVNMSGSGIGLSTWKITACWQVNSAAKKRIREGANPPCRESSRHLAQIFSRFLPVAHRGWMNPSRQLPAFDPRQIRPGNPRARLELALRHPARFAQLSDTLPYILHRLAVRPLLEELPVVARKLLRLRWRN